MASTHRHARECIDRTTRPLLFLAVHLFFMPPTVFRPSESLCLRSNSSWCQKSRARHDDALLDAAIHGWNRHDAAMFAQVSALDLLKAWEAHDHAVFSRLDGVMISTADKVPAVDPFAVRWTKHDEAVFTGIEALHEGWLKHDRALFQQAISAPDVMTAAWRRHDEALLPMLLSSKMSVKLPRKARRSLARAHSNLEEMTTTLVRGARGLGDISAYDQDTLFEGGAAGYSL
jgi:hypothetical protein